MLFLQIVDDRKTKNLMREKCMVSVKRLVTENDEYIVKEILYSNDFTAMFNEIDKIRFTFAKERDDLFYVDADCFIFALPTVDQLENKVVFGETISESGPIIDSFLFYVNGRKDIFQQKYETLIKKKDIPGLSPLQRESLAGAYVSYDPFSYCHLSLTSLEISLNKQFTFLTNKINGYEKEINAYRTELQNMNNTAQLFDELRQKDNNDGRIRQQL